ncbi:hypothetical protein ABZ746_22450 [Streptomyces sp. NPDC020096]
MTVHDVARQLPERAVLREHCRSMSMLEADLSPERVDRYHSFDASRPLTDAVVTALNPDATLADLAEDSAEIGCPQG